MPKSKWLYIFIQPFGDISIYIDRDRYILICLSLLYRWISIYDIEKWRYIYVYTYIHLSVGLDFFFMPFLI